MKSHPQSNGSSIFHMHSFTVPVTLKVTHTGITSMAQALPWLAAWWRMLKPFKSWPQRSRYRLLRGGKIPKGIGGGKIPPSYIHLWTWGLEPLFSPSILGVLPPIFGNIQRLFEKGAKKKKKQSCPTGPMSSKHLQKWWFGKNIHAWWLVNLYTP